MSRSSLGQASRPFVTSPSTTAIFKPVALRPCPVHTACTVHTRCTMKCFTTATRVASPVKRDTGKNPGSFMAPSAASSDESRTRVAHSFRIGSRGSVEARCVYSIRHFCLCSGRRNRPLGRDPARGIYPTCNVVHVARIDACEMLRMCNADPKRGGYIDARPMQRMRLHESHRHPGRCAHNERHRAHHRAKSRCRRGTRSTDDSLDPSNVRAAIPVARGQSACTRADSSMNQNPPPPSAPRPRPPPLLLAARGIAADGSRLA